MRKDTKNKNKGKSKRFFLEEIKKFLKKN